MNETIAFTCINRASRHTKIANYGSTLNENWIDVLKQSVLSLHPVQSTCTIIKLATLASKYLTWTDTKVIGLDK